MEQSQFLGQVFFLGWLANFLSISVFFTGRYFSEFCSPFIMTCNKTGIKGPTTIINNRRVNLLLRFYSVGGKPIFFEQCFLHWTLFFGVCFSVHICIQIDDRKLVTGTQEQHNRYPDPAAVTQVSGTKKQAQHQNTKHHKPQTKTHHQKRKTNTRKQSQYLRNHHTKITRLPFHSDIYKPQSTDKQEKITLHPF